MDEVVCRLRDSGFMHAMTERTYADLVTSSRYSLDAFIKGVDEVLDCAQPQHRHKWRYQLAQAERPLWVGFSFVYWSIRFLSDGNLPRMLKFYLRRWRK